MSIKIYGREFNTNSPLDVELYAFKTGLTVAQGGLGRTQHFIRVCKELWPSFEWHEWAIEMAEALCEYEVSGFTSGASSGKSEIMAKFAVVTWFADPVHTLVIACSTTAVDAKQKVWGHIVRNYREARAAKKSVGTLVESQNIIRLSEKSDGIGASDNSSICLVAAGDAFRDDALKRLQGRHQKHVCLILDELQDCSQEIITTALGNLSANIKFEVHAAGNAASRYDAHGLFLTPTCGWNLVNRTTHKWEIQAGGKKGIAVHFDVTADDSPNIKRQAMGIPQLAYLRKAEESIAAKIHYGEKNSTYLRQYVGFWSENEGETDFLYTDISISSHQGDEKAVWKTPPSLFAGIDPSYSSGGDRFVLSILKYGLTEHNIWTIEFYEDLLIRPILIKGETKDDGNVRECKRLCEERDITPRNVGADASAGTAILSIMHRTWSHEILGVQFGGSPTDLPISAFDKRIASDMYANAVSELWGVGVDFLHAGQIRGLRPDRINELVSRKYSKVAGDKVKVESKTDMKLRIGFSPDISDAGFVGLRVIRERLKITAGAKVQTPTQKTGEWKAIQRKSDVVSRSAEDFASMFKSRLG